ncbi:MAG: hypothetical protein ACI4SI_08965 [Candidatus Ornithospirochaeta sp.]
MITIENVEVAGIRKAIEGMRYAMNSWGEKDSGLDNCYAYRGCGGCPYKSVECNNPNHFFIGEADMKLCKNLIKAGSSDRKFLRMIHVQADVIAPMYFINELDSYQVIPVKKYCFPTNRILDKEFTLDDFSCEHLISNEPVPCRVFSSKQSLMVQIDILNTYREMYLEYKDEAYWWQMIQLLPSSYNQRCTIDLNYEKLFSIYCQNKNHKLDEWVEFCKWIETLPYMKEFLGLDEHTETEE